MRSVDAVLGVKSWRPPLMNAGPVPNLDGYSRCSPHFILKVTRISEAKEPLGYAQVARSRAKCSTLIVIQLTMRAPGVRDIERLWLVGLLAPGSLQR